MVGKVNVIRSLLFTMDVGVDGGSQASLTVIFFSWGTNSTTETEIGLTGGPKIFSGRRVEKKNWSLKGMVTHKIIHFCTLIQSLFILGELNSASTLQFWPICKILTDLNNLCRISPDWILKKFGWEQIHPMFTRMKNVSDRQEKNADSEKWENVVERERWILANILQFRSNPLLVLHGSLKCSAAQIKNATNSNSFAPWTLERTNKPTDHWIWKHWNALKRTVNQELHDIQMQQTLLLPHAKKTFDLLPHHICLNITLKPIRNLYLLFSLRRGHWWNLETIQNE